nr:DUF3068 domain-containing protein [Streptomyces sp. SID5468]
MCATLSPLLRWYAFPRLARVPAGQYQVVVLEARNATLLDYTRMKAVTVPKVSIVQTLRGDVAAARRVLRETGRHVVVWDGLSYVADPRGRMVSEIPERYVFDAHSQAPVHAAGENVDGDPVRRTGIEYKWPFLTEKRDYDYFDPQTRTSAPIHYRGTRAFHGLTVYYFEQTVPWTRVPVPRKLPLGVTPAVVRAAGMERWYTTRRMFWVDPVTGAPVDGEEIHREEMRYPGRPGTPPLTAFAGDVRMRPDYVASTVALVKSQRRLVLLLTTYLPWGLAGAGALLLALALVLEARGRTVRAAGPAYRRGLVRRVGSAVAGSSGHG